MSRPILAFLRSLSLLPPFGDTSRSRREACPGGTGVRTLARRMVVLLRFRQRFRRFLIPIQWLRNFSAEVPLVAGTGLAWSHLEWLQGHHEAPGPLGRRREKQAMRFVAL